MQTQSPPFLDQKPGNMLPGKMARSVSALLMAIMMCGLVSCAGAKFDREWKDALSRKPGDLTGAWEGRWHSHANGHAGDLKCIVKPVQGMRDVYSFQYHATWQKFLSGVFTIQCKAVSDGPGRWSVTGSKDLGDLLGGPFSHRAEITPQSIHAHFQSRLDHGEMDLARPGADGISTKSTTPAR